MEVPDKGAHFGWSIEHYWAFNVQINAAVNNAKFWIEFILQFMVNIVLGTEYHTM